MLRTGKIKRGGEETKAEGEVQGILELCNETKNRQVS